MRTADYMGVLYQSGLVKFGSKQEMKDSDDPIIKQFLSGRAEGPIGIDEMGEEESDIERELRERERARMGDEEPEIMTV
jgi:phospholipid/cholesterol/gamma-HCH transport system ATP-binding protein